MRVLMRMFHMKHSHQHFACFVLESRKVGIILVLDPHEAEDADLLGFRQAECDNSAVSSPYTTIRVTIHEEVSMGLTRRQILAHRAEHLRRNMTCFERKLWRHFLCRYEPPFRAQKVIGNYIVDFYCRAVRLSIEIDGDSHYEPRSIEYDKTRTMFLATQEIKELRFTNREIRDEFEGVCAVIDEVVRSRRHDLHCVSLDLLKMKR